MPSTPLPSPPARPTAPRLLFTPRALLVLLTLLAACDETPVEGPYITRVDPNVASPGDSVRIEGQGFGVDGYVAIGGRPVTTTARDDHRITVTLPADLAGGEALVVVFAAGRPSPPYPLDVRGPTGAVDRPHHFPPDLDIDDGIPPRDGGPIDRGGPDFGVPDLVARFDPDPSGVNAARVEMLPSPTGQLRLAVRVPESVRGLAFHLAYDRGLLRFQDAEPRGGRTFAVAEIGPGRLALGRVFAARPSQEATTVLRFALVGPGEGRIDMPRRRLAVRDGDNQPIGNVAGASGGLRVEPLE